MKKFMLTTVLTISLFACGHKIIQGGERLTQPGNVPGSSFVLPGRYVYQSKCGTCHGLKNITDYTASQWNEILQAMIPKAKLNELEQQQLIAFIGHKVKQ